MIGSGNGVRTIQEEDREEEDREEGKPLRAEAGEEREEDREEEDAQASGGVMATQNYPAGRLPKLVGGKLEGRNGSKAGMGTTQKGNGKPAPKLPAKNLTPPRKPRK